MQHGVTPDLVITRRSDIAANIDTIGSRQRPEPQPGGDLGSASAHFTALLLGGDGTRSMVRYGAELRDLAPKTRLRLAIRAVQCDSMVACERSARGVGNPTEDRVRALFGIPAKGLAARSGYFSHSRSCKCLVFDRARSSSHHRDLPRSDFAFDFSTAIDVPMAAHIGWTFLLRMRLMTRAAYVIAVSESTRRDMVKYLGIDPASGHYCQWDISSLSA